MNYDLNDPLTKALWDSYGEDEKQDFEKAYIYMKYLREYAAIEFSQYLNRPMSEMPPEIAELDPEVLDKINAAIKAVDEGMAGGTETSLYHTKVVQLENAKKLVTQEVDLELEVPETIVPFKLARNVILKNPDSIAVGSCPCRQANPESSCMPAPMEACLFLGDPHASFIAQNNPLFRKISQEEAVKILEDCHERGFVHCAYFKKDMGKRLYAICNCCACCCGGVLIANTFFDGALPFSGMAASGLVAEIDDECIGCGDCVETCPFHAIKMNEDESRVEVDLKRCMGCGVCEDQCTTGAISFRVEPSKGGVFDLEELKKAAL